MKMLKYISFLGLILTVFPSFFVFRGELSLEQHKLLALVGTLIWISTAPFWINKTKPQKKQMEQE